MEDWPIEISGVAVMQTWDYLQRPWQGGLQGVYVYKLCGSHAYQSSGYYVSLLAAANDHKVLPGADTINDMQLCDIPSVVQKELKEIAARCLAVSDGKRCSMKLFFGRCCDPSKQELAKFLFYFFPCPLLQVDLEHDGRHWQLTGCAPLVPGDLPAADVKLMIAATERHFSSRLAGGKKRVARTKGSKHYQLAILVNAQEKTPPSNQDALCALEKAGTDMGIDVRFLERKDAHHVREHDALLIRETTAVNHHTYEIARAAERAGLVVIDDPESILRCTNKVFVAQLLQRHAISQPDTVLIHRGNLGLVPLLIGFPCVVKRPDSQFSIGVVKVTDMDELHRVCRELMIGSDMLIAQRYEFTPFDWRVGVLGGVPLYACRYHMVEGHWQVRLTDADSVIHEGRHDTLAIADTPAAVVRAAVAAAKAVGRGLYGVDLKQIGSSVKVIEVNDNPNIDAGVEDQVLGADLYRRIMRHFIECIDSKRNAYEITT